MIHANMWDVYTSERRSLIKGGYFVEMSGSLGSGRKSCFEEPKENEEIGLKGFDFNFFRRRQGER